MAGDGDDEEAEHERFGQPHPDVVHVQPFGDRRPVEARVHLQLIPRDDPAAENADEIGDHREHRRHDDAGEHPRDDELAHRIGAERAQRVDLIGDDHRPELGGDARSDAAGQHERRQHGAELFDHRRAHQPADDGPGAELVERQAALRRQRGAGEESGEQHDSQRADADHIELFDDVVAIDGRRDEAAERGGHEVDILLHLVCALLEPALNERQHAVLRLFAPAAAVRARGCAVA